MEFKDLLQKRLARTELDIRKKPKGSSRYIDQKVTPDVLAFISDCIMNYLDGKEPGTTFTVQDLWNFQYFQKNVVAIFGKPLPTNLKAAHEYDKFIAQPLKTLSFSNVIEENKVGVKNVYKLNDIELLDYISQNERNSWLFLVMYLEKVLADSGFIKNLETYKNKALSGYLKQEDFKILKEKFEKFTRGNTNIKGTTEIRRIFPKVLNPYAAHFMINGSTAGRMGKNRFTYSDLMYNRNNFRDLNKDKTITRQEAQDVPTDNTELIKYKVQKAKAIVKRNHDTSEVKDSLAHGEATQTHHIFPEHQFPKISAYVENLVLLTAQQHNTRAHPKNNTRDISRDYQKECLLAKIDSIEKSLNDGKDTYSKESFIHVINVGLGINLPTTISFTDLKKTINESYA